MASYTRGGVRRPASFRPARVRKKPGACPPKLVWFQASEGGSEFTEKFSRNALRETGRWRQLGRSRLDAGHPQMLLLGQPNQVRQDPDALPFALHLTEHDVARLERVADGDDVAPVAGYPKGGRVADDGEPAHAGRGELRDEGVGQILRVAIVVREAGLVVEPGHRNRVRWTVSGPGAPIPHAADNGERDDGGGGQEAEAVVAQPFRAARFRRAKALRRLRMGSRSRRAQ